MRDKSEAETLIDPLLSEDIAPRARAKILSFKAKLEAGEDLTGGDQTFVYSLFDHVDRTFYAMVSQFQRSVIAKALEQTDGNKKQAAELLQMKRTTLNAMIRGARGDSLEMAADRIGLITPMRLPSDPRRLAEMTQALEKNNALLKEMEALRARAACDITELRRANQRLRKMIRANKAGEFDSSKEGSERGPGSSPDLTLKMSG